MCACKSYEAIVRDGGDTHTDAHTLAQNNLLRILMWNASYMQQQSNYT